MTPEDILDRVRRMWEARNPPFRNQEWMPQIEVDWQHHFKEFCSVHGGYPLFYAGRLLFADGWMHALDHRGPTYPPPENDGERRKLQRIYWKLRRNAIKKELPRSRRALEEVTGLLAQAGDIPIRYIVRNVDENEDSDTFGRVFTSKPPLSDLKQQLEQRIEWLEADMELCDLMIVQPEPEEVIT